VVAIVQRRSHGGGGLCGCGGRGWQVYNGVVHHIKLLRWMVLELGGAGIRVALFCGVI